jgi:hypothetical protein
VENSWQKEKREGTKRGKERKKRRKERKEGKGIERKRE